MAISRTPARRIPAVGLMGCIWLIAAFMGPAPALARREGAGDAESTLRKAISKLKSPLAHLRRDGALQIERTLPLGRQQVIAAFEGAPAPAQRAIAVLLLHEGSRASVEAVLERVLKADPVQRTALALAIVRDARSHQLLFDQYKGDPKAFVQRARTRVPGTSAAKAIDEFVGLLERAEIESLFVSRMSKSGGTGYYRGQYDILKSCINPSRALRIVTSIALNESMPIPGRFTTGPYEYLRKHGASPYELGGMATNAVAELCGPDDSDVIARIDERRVKLEREIRSERRALERMNSTIARFTDFDTFTNRVFDLGVKIGEYGEFLTCLYLIDSDTYERDVRRFLISLRVDYNRVRPNRIQSLPPVILIRVGWYEEAVAAFQRNLRGGSNSSDVLNYYNLACAYASWSLEPGDEDARALKHRALMCLSISVEKGWLDLDWMEEDRDLDPIRKDPQYRRIVSTIRKYLELPEREDEAPPK